MVLNALEIIGISVAILMGFIMTCIMIGILYEEFSSWARFWYKVGKRIRIKIKEKKD